MMIQLVRDWCFVARNYAQVELLKPDESMGISCLELESFLALTKDAQRRPRALKPPSALGRVLGTTGCVLWWFHAEASVTAMFSLLTMDLWSRA